jgi:hypothetical protein
MTCVIINHNNRDLNMVNEISLRTCILNSYIKNSANYISIVTNAYTNFVLKLCNRSYFDTQIQDSTNEDTGVCGVQVLGIKTISIEF